VEAGVTEEDDHREEKNIGRERRRETPTPSEFRVAGNI
jgi:hypothetical protein